MSENRRSETNLRARVVRALASSLFVSFVVATTSPPASHAAPAEIAIVAPKGATPVPHGGTTVIVGTARDESGVGRVKVGVKDLTSRRWLRRDGSWGARQMLDATVLDGGGATADWSLAFTPEAGVRYRIVARGFDRVGRALGVRASRRFRVVAPAPAPPIEGGLGEFVAFCPSSHRRRDDPIVFPGQPGQSHLHSFFGSTVTDAHSTLAPLLAGGTTCDPTVDRSAYWVPTLLENGVEVEPEQATFYYLTSNAVPGSLQAYPPGLRILAGTPSRTGPDGPSHYKWSCRGAPDSSTGDFVVCPPGHELELLLNFPDCWNGRDLDAPDHKAHMAYSAGGKCPQSHPVAVPRLQFKLRYPTSGGPGVRIAGGSGIHAHHGSNGYSAHGDFFNAWQPAALEERIERCLRRKIKCGADGKPS